jgi:guanylate kinase
MLIKRGLLIVISGPSGVGKGAICSRLREKKPNLIYSISATSRIARPEETDGLEYFFKNRHEFEQMISDGLLLEWTEYCGNYYGTPLEFVEENLAAGRDVLLEIEVEGALNVRLSYPDGVYIFLIPPSFAELRNRLTYRGTEHEDIIKGRMDIAIKELKMAGNYDYIVVNDDLEKAVNAVITITEAERYRKERILNYLKSLLEEEIE